MEYYEIDRARMEPDVYSGLTGDQHEPRWVVSVEKEGVSIIGKSLKLYAAHYPPGTQIIVKVPVCPKCGDQYEICLGLDICNFNWKKWTEEQYG